jgi:hypothetical protein
VFDEQDQFSRDFLGNLYHCRDKGMLLLVEVGLLTHAPQRTRLTLTSWIDFSHLIGHSASESANTRSAQRSKPSLKNAER